MNIDWGVIDKLEKPIKRFKHKVLDSDYEDFKNLTIHCLIFFN